MRTASLRTFHIIACMNQGSATLGSSVKGWFRKCFGQGSASAKIRNCRISLCPLPSSNVGPLSYPAPFPLPWYPFPYVLNVFPGFLNTSSFSHAYSWIGVNEWLAVLTDKVRGKETNIFEPCYMPGTVSWQDFSYSPDRDKWILKGILARGGTGKILLTTRPSPSQPWGLFCPKALLAVGYLGPRLKVPRTSGSACGKELGPVDRHNPSILPVLSHPNEHLPILFFKFFF